MKTNIIIGSGLLIGSALAYYFLIYKKKGSSSMDAAGYASANGVTNTHGCKNGEKWMTHAGVQGCWGSGNVVNNPYGAGAKSMNFQSNF